MKFLLALAALATSVSAHYIFPQFVAGGVNSSAWQFTRQTNNWQDLNPVTDVTTTDIRCYTSLQSGTSSTVSVAAGSTVGFITSPTNMYHQGVVNVYMAKAPTGTDVASWDGSGQVWFKVFEVTAQTDGGTSINWPATLLTEVNFQIPAATPSGQYLIRIEQIALHVAETFQGAQFYISCAQVQVTGGGSGTPGPLVAFPGAYTGMEPGILINIYFPIPVSYVQPGPAVWPAVGGGSGGSPPATTVKSTTAPVTTVKSTTAPPTTVKTTTAPPTTTTSNPSGGTVAEWGQCGGQGYTGATQCAGGFTCTELNPFFFQCL